MPYPLKARFLYGVPADTTDWTTTITQRPWQRTTRTIGGSRIAAGGEPASHVVRRDYLLAVTLRLYESERPNLDALVEWGQSSESFFWFPDADEPTYYSVYLDHPVAGEDLVEQRDPDFPSVVEVTIVLRRVDGYAWGLDYFAEPGT